MELHVSKYGKRLALVIAACAALSIGLAIWGWHYEVPWSDAVYRGIKTIEMAEAYDHVAVSPEPTAEAGNAHPAKPENKHLYLQAARFLGVLVALSTLIAFLLTIFQRTWIHFQAGLRRNHVIVSGESRFATMLARHTRTRVTHVGGHETAVVWDAHTIHLPAQRGLQTLADAAAGKAAFLILAHGNDGATLSAGIASRHAYPHLPVFLHLKDHWLAQRVHRLPGAEKLRAFSDAGVGAREVIRRHPPFLMAQDNTQTRIHALIIGDHDWIEAIMAEIIASNCTLFLGKPFFSIVCENGDAFHDRLGQRYPEIELAADFAFYEAGRLTQLHTNDTSLHAITRPCPLTCIYIARAERESVLSIGLTLSELAGKEAGFTAPVFVVADDAGSLPQPPSGARLAALSFVPFGRSEDLVRGIGLMTREADLAEQVYHNAYRALPFANSEAAKPWNELNEEYRVSNARAVAHIYAKLFELGFDLRPWMASHDIWGQLPSLAPDEPLFRDEDERRRLAELEHQRWIEDRRLNGWSYGPVRDNTRRIHPDIKPFAELSPEVQHYDYMFVDLLDQILDRKPEGLRRPLPAEAAPNG